MKEKREFSLFPHHHHHRNKSETHTAIVIRQPVIVQELERVAVAVTGASAVPTPEGGSPFPKGTASLPKQNRSLSKRWFLGSLKGFFGPRQPSTSHGSPTRLRSTKATTTTVRFGHVTLVLTCHQVHIR